MSEMDTRIEDAKKFLTLASQADSNNRVEAIQDLKFASGEQWPVEVQNSRNLEARPCLTINKIDAFIRQVTNQQRQARPRIKVHGMNDQADEKLAEIINGIVRHIEVNSDADQAYDTAFDSAVRMGWGYWRIITDYPREDSFDQEIYIRPIDNPFTVYWDPNSVMPDGSDAERCLITTIISKAQFRKMYPNADEGNFSQRGTGDSDADWVMKEDIRIAEYFYTERIPKTLVMLSDGTSAFEDDLPSPETLALSNITILDRRPSYKKVVRWCKLTGMEVLEESTWAGKYIPVVPVYGQVLVLEGKRKKYGLVRMAKDAQRMYNYWQTSMTESVALAPKAKWLIAEGQDEGHENEWAQANIKSAAVLRYKQKDIEGQPAPPPTRLQPEPPPIGVMTAAESINKDLQAVVGIVDPNQLPQGNISGKALMGQQQQIDLSNFHYFDNLTRSIRHTGKIILDLIPKIYDRERVLRIIGADGQPEMVTLNERKVDELGVEKVLNDVTIGEYDVVMDTGPGYQSKRLEAVNAMMPLLANNEQLFQIAGDLVFRNMDFPGADVIADRLAAANPMAQIDEKTDLPPQVQMQIMQAKQNMDAMAQQIEALQMEIRNRGQIAQIKEEGATRRKLMEVTARAHNTETMAEVKVNDQNTRSITSQNKTEIDAIVELLIHNLNTDKLIAEIDRRNREQQYYAQFAAQDIEHGANPFTQQNM